VFGKGNTGSAVRASCSIPGVFQPVRIGDRTYVDGGVVSPVAVDAARRLGADVVIAVDISGGVAGLVPETTLDTIFQSVNVMYAKIAAAQLSRADVVIHPKVGHIASRGRRPPRPRCQRSSNCWENTASNFLSDRVELLPDRPACFTRACAIRPATLWTFYLSLT
jgi:predicted acylesterase/phospholipase RssA